MDVQRAVPPKQFLDHTEEWLTCQACRPGKSGLWLQKVELDRAKWFSPICCWGSGVSCKEQKSTETKELKVLMVDYIKWNFHEITAHAIILFPIECNTCSSKKIQSCVPRLTAATASTENNCLVFGLCSSVFLQAKLCFPLTRSRHVWKMHTGLHLV